MTFSRAVLAAAASSALGAHAGLVVRSFAPYPGYSGNLSVGGAAAVGQALGDEVVLWYSFIGADPLCNGTDNGQPNSCGIHIHSGMSCDTAGGVGGHYYEGVAEDPWAGVQYTLMEDGQSAGVNVVVEAGTSLAQNKGRTVVVHDSAGMRIACGVLELDVQTAGTEDVYAGAFDLYPGYGGSLAVSGSATLMQTAALENASEIAVVLRYSLEGVDPECSATASRTAANACGIHVHVGSCASAANVGGHYFEGEEQDPWSQIVYFSDADGKTGASVSTLVQAHAAVESMIGRSLVVHDMTGARVGCADLSATPPTPRTQKVLSSGGKEAVGRIGTVAAVFVFVAATLF